MTPWWPRSQPVDTYAAFRIAAYDIKQACHENYKEKLICNARFERRSGEKQGAVFKKTQ
jgi:hypothetical protein